MTEKPLDVVVVGNVGIDTNVYIQGDDINLSLESNFTENVDCVGQAGGYSSRGYARLKKQTAFIGHVGDDMGGHCIREVFAREGIDTKAIFTDPAGTCRSVNFMYRNGRRKNFYDGKSHMKLRPDMGVCRAILAGARLVHFNIPNWARSLLPVAKELGLTIACDIQDLVSVHDSYREDFVKYADILFFSAVNHPKPRKIIETFLALRPRQVVLAGMGAEGCALGTRDGGVEFFDAVQMEQSVVDTNGAGDALAVGFLVSYVLEQRSIADAVKRGLIAARYACTVRASSSNLITAEQLEQYVSGSRKCQ